MKCWAKSVSECCNTQSREHYVTKGLFSDKMLYVDGAPFLNGETKKIAKASLTKKCLCKKHNEQLSKYDSEAISFGRALEYAHNLSLERRHSKENKFSVHKKYVQTDSFCKWLVKTYLGVLDFFKYPSQVDEEYLAQLVYSKNSITEHVKLTISMVTGEDLNIRQVVSIAPLYLGEETVGIQIELYGIRIHGVFNTEPMYKQKPLQIKFNEHRQGLSCIIRFK